MSDAPIDEIFRKIRDAQADMWDVKTQQLGAKRKMKKIIGDTLMFHPVSRQLFDLVNEMIEQDKRTIEELERCIDNIDEFLDERS